ncbi:MAG: metallophosphoesterase [Gammaproteobacteria bacterium]|nr:metallophosphoesterase [Gammaproteobacteria bacterium]
MKIQIASDLHLEMRRYNEPEIHDFYPVEDREVLVLAGDIGTYVNAWSFVEQELRRSPVIYVPGNHEYYTWQTREHTDDAWKIKAKQYPDLHYLVAEGVTINGVRFWGAPWYSDLFGRRDPGHLRMIAESLNDFDRKFDDFGRWTVHRHLEEHARQTQLLREEADLVDVVVTHWPPTRDAIAPRFKGDGMNGYFVNDREDLVEDIGAQIWISGHVHDPYRAVIGNTLVIGNPTGYPGEQPESGLFRPDFAIELEPDALKELED